jgi:hypothetical protein
LSSCTPLLARISRIDLEYIPRAGSRSQLDAARTTAGRQVLAAICNATLLDALRPAFLDTYLEVLLGDDIDAILALSGDSDLYNNSGDDEPIDIPGSADPFANNDDPSDPSD